MTILEFDHPLTHNVKSRDPVGSKNINSRYLTDIYGIGRSTLYDIYLTYHIYIIQYITA